MTLGSFKRVVPAGSGGWSGTRTGGVAPRPATAAAIRDSRRLDRTGPCRPQGLFGRVGRSGTEEFRRGGEIGRASCRERVCQYVEISVVAGSLKKKETQESKT